MKMAKKRKKSKKLTTEERIARMEKVLKGKELREDGMEVFEQAIQTAVKKPAVK